MTVHILTLGCSKNLVDSEHLLAQFRASGYQVLHNTYEANADVVIINTCGFILDAKEESVDTILSYVEEKKRGTIRKLFVMGCLSERYKEDLSAEMPEVDGFYGVWEMPAILEAMGSKLDQLLLHERVLTTPSHYAYLKISEGCNRSCAFCAIPGIRGVQQSISVEDLINESQNLVRHGVRELILIAQDLTNYGMDLYGNRALPELLRQLVKIKDLEWIRLHYAFPTGFPEEVIDLMASEEKICNYLDIPIQHVNNPVLKAMGRGHNREDLENLLNLFRAKVPGVALRTTVLTGFPGETEEAFSELLQFITEFRFDRLGVFPYSHEEDTTAYKFYKDTVPARLKSKRASTIMELQQGISLELNNEKIGKAFKVLIDRKEGGYYVGRTQYDSPEVDNEVLVEDKQELTPGNFYQVRITGAGEFDLYGVPDQF
ncbi:MAG: 30S ribosomal protein S12 methylthiotransferase RimO [Bacteroidales bacterium]|nr:30S ribosomal protein S12 methylthiotransferase RimO [Bacteroidales bacterium]